VDQLLRARKIPARPRPCRGRLTVDLSTHQWREWPQHALCEYTKEDGTGHHQEAHPQQGSILWYHPRERNYTTRFGGTTNYLTEHIKFEVADFESSYHTILGRPALAKFMAVPHYVHLLLKMPGKTGVLTFHGDLKKSYDCDQEAIEYAATSRVLEPSAKVFVATQSSPTQRWRSPIRDPASPG
jgi:hypothetical protein